MCLRISDIEEKRLFLSVITITFDQKTAAVWGKIQAFAEKAAKPMPAIDGQITATGICFDLTVVTRNAADMQISGVSLYDPCK